MDYIVANWKSQKTTADGKKWLDSFVAQYQAPQKKVQIVLAPTVLSLEHLVEYAKKCALKDLSFAVQDISPFPRGKYTGAVAADLVKGMADYAIVGHSERLRYFHETAQDTLNKASEAVDCRIIPIVCVPDEATLSALSSLADGEFLPAYTPHDPHISGTPEQPDKIAEMAAKIKRTLAVKGCLYGGAITAENCQEYMKIDGINGLFVGEASLNAKEFAAICNAVE